LDNAAGAGGWTFQLIRQYEPGVIGIGTQPPFAIGQRALVVCTPNGTGLRRLGRHRHRYGGRAEEENMLDFIGTIVTATLMVFAANAVIVFIADRPDFAMAVDVEIGEAGAVRGMEQLGRLRQPNQDVGLLRATSARW
jgi:hypothetical protein